LAVRVWDWLLSITGAEGVIVTDSTELTVTMTVVVAVPPRESVTRTQYVVVDEGEAMYVLDEALCSAVPLQLLPE
jgi:hypothetical protein